MSVDQFANSAFWNPARYVGIAGERAGVTLSWLPEDARTVLDVGCGNGTLTNRLRDKELAVGVDRFYTPLALVQTPSAQSDILNLPFADRAFDAVMAAEVIEHIPDAEYGRALAELARVARLYVLITVPYMERLWVENVRCPQCGLWFQMNGHQRSYRLADMVNLYARGPDLRPLRIAGIVPIDRAALIREARAAWTQIMRPAAAWTWFAVCPRCGHRDAAGAPAPASEQRSPVSAHGLKRRVRKAVRSAWPRDRSPRWWAALYAKQG